MWKVAPLKSSFMLASIIGFLITVIYTLYGRISETWGFSIGFVFALMFIAALISMTYAPLELQLEMAPDLVRLPEKKPAKKKPAKRRPAAKKASPAKKPAAKKAKPAKKVKPKKAAKKKAAKKAKPKKPAKKASKKKK